MSGPAKDTEVISGMFDGISSEYDKINHILSLGVDVSWRKRLVRALRQISTGNDVLDLACGTGDSMLALLKSDFNVTGADISDGMLAVARKKIDLYLKKSRIEGLNDTAGVQGNAKSIKGAFPQLINASADNLPFEDESFDAVTISFGIRNFDNRAKCLKEIYRVLKRDGKLVILEFATPRNKIWRAVYLFYFKNILPFVGGMLSKNRAAYEYLHSSVMSFPAYSDFLAEFDVAGFVKNGYSSLSGGIALLYEAEKDSN